MVVMIKQSKTIKSIIAVFIALFAVTVLHSNASSSILTDSQINQVKNNCVSAKATLNQLHASDALLRVNSGQIYESLSTKLMDKFNARLANNNFGNSTLVSISINYEQALDEFRQDYMNYENQITKTLNYNCTSEPVAFYESVLESRVKREKVYGDVVKLNKYIEEYKAAVDLFKLDYQAVSDGVN